MNKEQRFFVDGVKVSVGMMTDEQRAEVREAIDKLDRADLAATAAALTAERKRKAVSMLYAAEAANEHASLAVMSCGIETPEAWRREFGYPMHVVLEHQAQRAARFRAWIEELEVK